jgi:hypothetical protein
MCTCEVIGCNNQATTILFFNTHEDDDGTKVCDTCAADLLLTDDYTVLPIEPPNTNQPKETQHQ